VSKTIFSVPQVDLQMVRRQFSEDDMNRAGALIGQLDNALKIALQEQDALGKVMQECGAANAALGQELRRVFTELGKGNKVTPQQLKAIRDKNEFQQLNRKLQQSVDEANKFRAELRVIKDEMGIVQDARERAVQEAKEQRSRVQSGLYAKATSYLEKYRNDLNRTEALNGLIEALGKINEKTIEKKRPTEDIVKKFNELVRAAREDVPLILQPGTSFVAESQPPQFVALFKDLVTKILSIKEVEELLQQAENTQNAIARMKTEIDSELSALKAHTRSGAGRGGGSAKRTGAFRRKIAKTKRHSRQDKNSRGTRKNLSKTRKSKRS
jgi:predicted  nucleic acid-binding Zn-ribbon protein